jgi:hypothetical protein
MAKELTLQLGDADKQVTVDSLVAALRNTLEMLRNMERHFAGSAEPIRWEIIRAGMQSPLTITVVPRPARGEAKKRIGDKVLNAYASGLRILQRKAELPPHFDEDTLEAAQRLASVARDSGTPLKIFTPNQDQFEIDEQVIAHAQEVAAKARKYIDYGTIEGKLELISTHDGDSFSIWETLTGHKIDCHVTPEQLEQAKSLLRHRVAVTGGIRYRNDKPRTVEVEHIRVLREQAELPQPMEIGPIDITGGESSEDYIRRLRDAR